MWIARRGVPLVPGRVTARVDQHETLAGGEVGHDIRGVGLVAQLRGEVLDGGIALGVGERGDGCGGGVGHAPRLRTDAAPHRRGSVTDRRRRVSGATTTRSTLVRGRSGGFRRAIHHAHCPHGISVDHHRTSGRPRHHHVRARPLAHARRLRPGRQASEGGDHRTRLPAHPAAGHLPRPGVPVPAAADPRGRHDAARRLARRHDGEPLQPPVPRRRRPQHLADCRQLGHRGLHPAADHQLRDPAVPARPGGARRAVREGRRGVRDRAHPGRDRHVRALVEAEVRRSRPTSRCGSRRWSCS